MAVNKKFSTGSKVKLSVSINIDIDKRLKAANSKSSRRIKEDIVDILVEQISSGISPVKGFNRFKAYSKSYAPIKGRLAPVDFIVSGELLESLKATQSGNTILVAFTGARNKKIAQAHQLGLGKLKGKARKLLPSESGQTLKDKITRKITKSIDTILGLELNK